MGEALWGFLGTLVGAGVSIATQLLALRHASSSQQHADNLQRAERARAFQRETLLAIQDTLQEGMRSAAMMVHHDILAEKRGSPWGTTRSPNDISEQLRLANARLTALVERVADDGLRATLKHLHGQMNEPPMATSRPEAETLLSRASQGSERAMAHLGAILRTYY